MPKAKSSSAKKSNSAVSTRVKRPAKGTAVPEEGTIWSLPLKDMGQCSLVVTRATPPDSLVDFVVVYVLPDLDSKKLLSPQYQRPDAWPTVWIGLVTTQGFRKGRWKQIGKINNFARKDWPVPPYGKAEMATVFSPKNEPLPDKDVNASCIEITADEPTMTVIDCVPAEFEEAKQFPPIEVITAASKLEAAVVVHLKKKVPGNWDPTITVTELSPKKLELWKSRAAKMRSAAPPTPTNWLPPGKHTDRSIPPGTWLGFPMRGGGFGAALLIDRPEKHLRFFSDTVVMVMGKRWDRWPPIDELVKLTPEDAILFAHTSFISVRDGRWRALGSHPSFPDQNWVWPRQWFRTANGNFSISGPNRKNYDLKLDPKIVALDPNAGYRGGTSGYSVLEHEAMRRINGWIHPVDTERWIREDVTPSRLNAWRLINAEIERALAKAQSRNS